MSGISPVSATTSAMSPNEIGRPLSYLRERSPLGFLSLIADPPSSHEILYVNCPTKFVLEPDPCHWHDPPLGEYRIKQGQLLLKKFDKKLIAPLLNGFYLVFHMDSASVTLHKRQLAVVFDLDNTLVHSVETDHPALYARGADVHHLIFREPYEHQDSHVVTKVRPGAREVLKALQEKFSLYICTMGTKSYVTQALKVLDPDGTIFKHAICREDLPSLPDDPNVLVKDLYRIKVVQDPTWTLVVDDSPDVWVQKHGHVLPITKYYYFTDDYPVDSYRNAVPSLYSVRVVLESIHRQCIFGDKPWEVSMLQMLEKYHRS
jgi:FMN phosphatase YigB (HAD superfamily)